MVSGLFWANSRSRFIGVFGDMSYLYRDLKRDVVISTDLLVYTCAYLSICRSIDLSIYLSIDTTVSLARTPTKQVLNDVTAPSFGDCLFASSFQGQGLGVTFCVELHRFRVNGLGFRV